MQIKLSLPNLNNLKPFRIGMYSQLSTMQAKMYDLFTAGVADQAVCLIDPFGSICAWNTGAANFYKFNAENITGKSLNTLMGDIDTTGYLEQAFATGISSFEGAAYRNDGTSFPAYFTIQAFYEHAELCGYAFTARNLEYTKKLSYRFDEQIAQDHKRLEVFQQLTEHSHSGITLFDAELNFIYRSPSAARITGFNDQSRNNVTFTDIVHPADQSRIKLLLDKLRQTPGESIHCHLRSRHFEGHYIDLDGVFTNWLDEPHIKAIVLNFRDVSEWQKAEDALKDMIDELSAYKHALDAGAIVAITDQKGIIKHVNDNFCKISGYTEQELLGQDHRLVNSGYHDKAFMQHLWRTIASGRVWEGDVCNRRKDGSTYWVATTIVPFLNDHGKPYQYVAIRFDRTEAKLAKEELIAKNKQISSLLESITDGFIALDHDLRYVYVNQRVCEMVGISAGVMLGKKIWELFPEAVGSETWKSIEKAIATRQPATNEDYYAPLALWQENHIYPNEHGLSIFISDISWRKRKELQEKLLMEISMIFKKSGKLKELLQETMQSLIVHNKDLCLAESWLINRDGKRMDLIAQRAINEEMAQFFKENPNFKQVLPSQGLPGAAWASGSVEFWSDLATRPEFLRRDSAARTGLRSAFAIPLKHKEKFIGVLLLGQTHSARSEEISDHLLQKIGEQLGAEVSRLQLETDLQAIFNAAPDIIAIVGTDRYFKKVNPAMSTLLGYSEAALLSKRIDGLVHPDDLAESKARMRRFIKGELNLVYFENRYLTSKGAVVHLAWTAAKANEEGIIFCVARNISDKRQLELAANRFLTERNTILESIGDAFFSVDRDWTVQYWNHIAEQVLHTPKEQILGRNLWSVFKEAIGSPSYLQYHAALETGEVKHFEDYFAPLSKWYDVNVYPSDNGLSVFFKDITLRKQAEHELKTQAEALEISHQRYSDLFQLSPLPKFVFDIESLAYLDVNQAAVNHYGYTREEFLSMTLRDIRPESELELLQTVLLNASRSTNHYQAGTFTHRKKNGELIKVEITSSALQYSGRPARIALAQDVTERLRYLQAIEDQNEKLREISWMQSHIIRAPLTRIMGLVDLLTTTSPDMCEIKQILEFLRLSANELDQVIRDITDKANQPI